MKLIDVDQFRAWLKTIPLKDLSDGRGLCLVIMEEDFKRSIKNMPTECIIEAEPVRHGHWIYKKNSTWTQCSVCKRHILYSWDYDIADEYCRACGAKMDEPTEVMGDDE